MCEYNKKKIRLKYKWCRDQLLPLVLHYYFIFYSILLVFHWLKFFTNKPALLFKLNFRTKNLSLFKSRASSCADNLGQSTTISLSNSFVVSPHWNNHTQKITSCSWFDTFLKGHVPDSLYSINNFIITVMQCNLNVYLIPVCL